MILKLWHCQESPEVLIIKLQSPRPLIQWVQGRAQESVFKTSQLCLCRCSLPYFECLCCWISVVSKLHSVFKCYFRGPAFPVRIGPRTRKAVAQLFGSLPLFQIAPPQLFCAQGVWYCQVVFLIYFQFLSHIGNLISSLYLA